jgi:hypothetical protein
MRFHGTSSGRLTQALRLLPLYLKPTRSGRVTSFGRPCMEETDSEWFGTRSSIRVGLATNSMTAASRRCTSQFDPCNCISHCREHRDVGTCFDRTIRGISRVDNSECPRHSPWLFRLGSFISSRTATTSKVGGVRDILRQGLSGA